MSQVIIATRVLFYFLRKIVSMVFMRIFKPKSVSSWVERTVFKWSSDTLKILNIDAEVINQDKAKDFPDKKAVFIVANHQSYTDIPIALYSINRLFGFVAKEELGKIPLLNFWMKELKCVLINRKKFTNAIRFIKRSEKAGTLNPLTLFPEGTRSKNGEIGKFKPGVLKLAWSVRAHIQPLVIKGSRASFENVKLAKGPYRVKTILLDPIEWTEEMEKDYSVFSEHLRNKMIEAYNKL
jgi:DNA helicase-2/ATP-dependent DNA helicase PcrA